MRIQIEINRPQLRIERRAVRLQALLLSLILALTVAASRLRADTGTCGGADVTLPFTDVMGNVFFCTIAATYFTGLISGTSATTYSPDQTVTRGQLSAFITRTLDQSLRRGSQRAALGQFWTTSKPYLYGPSFTPPVNLIKSDGTDVYVAVGGEHQVLRLAAGHSQAAEVLATYTGIENAYGIAITPDTVFVTGRTSPGKLYYFTRGDSSNPGIAVLSNLGAGPTGIAYDGVRVWTANAEGDSVSIFNTTTEGVTTVAGFNNPFGILYDGANIWVTNYGHTTGNTLVKLDSNGSIIQTVTVGQGPGFPVYDGTNIWVPNYNANTISVVRAATGQVLATLAGNGLNFPNEIAFDGQRVIATNNVGNSLSLWKATDLTPLGSVSVSPFTNPIGVCSDGQDFWVTLLSEGRGTFTKF